EDGSQAIGRSGADGLIEVVRRLAYVGQVCDEDEAVQGRDPEEGKEADACREREVEPAEREHGDYADECEWDVGQDEERLCDRVEGSVEEDEDQEHGERDDEPEPFHRALLVLVLAAPFEEDALGEVDFVLDPGAGLLDEAAEITAADVAEGDDV